MAILVRLLSDLNIDTRYAYLLKDWIDPDNNPDANGGGEDTLYLTQTPAYRPPNTFVFHTSELLALPGFGAENYRKLAPFITALPQGTKLNVCTAPMLVLDATRNDPIGNQSEYVGVPPEQVKQNREKGCWPRMNDVFSVLSNPALQQTVQRPHRRDFQLVPAAHQHSYWNCGVRFVQSHVCRPTTRSSAPCSALLDRNNSWPNP